MRREIIPAVLARTREDAIQRLKNVASIAKMVQIDIIDGRFAPNTTIQPRDLWNVNSTLKFEFHLMVEHPEHELHDICHVKQARLVIFHVETFKDETHGKAIIRHARFHKLNVGLALNPETKAEKLKPYLKLIDHVTVMTVHPGFMGRTFIDQTKKIKQIRKWSKKIDIEVDGGIHHGTLTVCKKAGANKFVIGSALQGNIKETYKALKQELRS
ncbi:ribulose-phosphate 3-epimerase [Candidatus Woesearchaeota archaeon]|nr:ribulose-phosphate 3-epimerase [Candidatus Woesearchaeota archaeon]